MGEQSDSGFECHIDESGFRGSTDGEPDSGGNLKLCYLRT